MIGYELKYDYQKLWDYIHKGNKVAAWLDNEKYGTDIVEVKKLPDMQYLIGTRGVGYNGADGTFEEFKKICEDYNLGYIEPTITAPPPAPEED